MKKKQAVEGIAKNLKEKHGDCYNMVQYKFWAETLHNKRHSSWEDPPQGFIWGGQGKAKPKTEQTCSGKVAETMMKSVADMATTIASVINKSPGTTTQGSESISPPRQHGSSNVVRSTVGVSPGHKIDLQDKLLRQIELLHKMLESGAITPTQFEARRDSAMKQLENLD